MMWPGMVRGDANSPNTQMQPSCLKSETGFLHHPIDTPGQVRSSAYPTLESTSFHYTSYSGDMGFPGEFLPFILIGGLISAGLYGVTTLQGLMCISCTTPKTPLPKKYWLLPYVSGPYPSSFQMFIPLLRYDRTLSASPVPNACMISAVQLFFAHAIHSLCRPQVRWFVSAPIILLVLVHFVFDVGSCNLPPRQTHANQEAVTVVTTFVDMQVLELQRIRFYTTTPATVTTALAEVLITVSLCVLLYDSGSGFASSGTKRLLNTLIIYAVNRCLLNLLATIAELATVIEVQTAWSTGLSLITGSLYANSFLASLNSRKRLRPQNSSTESLAGEHVSTIHFVNLPRLSGDEHRPQDEVRRFDMHEVVIIDIGADASLDKATTLQRDETV
ncbi:hypothetical protein F5141DRAFT_184349 [Pisolithus sp. B1]|nr:hypothetical protein F5141DRAFT_184349 [Pisolithus sp. B1]